MGLPSKSSFFTLLTSRLFLPANVASMIVKWLSVVLGQIDYYFCIKYPTRAKDVVLKRVRGQMGPGIFSLSCTNTFFQTHHIIKFYIIGFNI